MMATDFYWPMAIMLSIVVLLMAYIEHDTRNSLARRAHQWPFWLVVGGIIVAIFVTPLIFGMIAFMIFIALELLIIAVVVVGGFIGALTMR